MKKFFFLVFLLLSVNTAFLLLNSCHSCGPSLCGYYTAPVLLPMDNADSVMRMPSGDGVLAKAFLLVLTLEDTTYKCVKAPAHLPVNAAYAECIKSSRLIPIDSIVLTSDRDFDAWHPAGANLKDLFHIPDSVKTYSGYRKSEYVHLGRNNLFLLHPPSDTGTHTFTIKLFAHDSTKNLTATAAPVKLLL